MIQIITFSFNRAMQLDTLLSTLIAHWNQPDYQIDVVYNYSAKEYGQGYDLFIEKFKDKPVTMHKEDVIKPDKITFREFLYPDNAIRLWRNIKLRKPKTDFRSIVVKILEQTNADNVMFLTDDSMFISDIDLPQNELDWINADPANRQFSLRLGKGISSLPEMIRNDGDFCAWDIYDNKGNWGYPFSVDAHIYNKSYVLQLFKKYIFTNPNTLEANVCSSVHRKKLLGEARCFADIKMLTFPINIVQNAVDNLSQNVSVEMLNERYLKGDHLQYVMDEEFNATKQYVQQIAFKDASENTSILKISDELTQTDVSFKEDQENKMGGAEVKIVVAGDYSPKERVQKSMDDNEWQTLFPGIRELTQNADLSIVNFESTIAELSDKPIKKIGCHLKTTYSSMFALKRLGFDMITLANNHSLDYGGNALCRTMTEAANLGIKTVGAGRDIEDARKPLVVDIKGRKIAVINACEHEFSIAGVDQFGCNPIDIISLYYQIQDVKSVSDYVICILHGGNEHYQLPSPRMKQWYRFLVDAGASAVINHHQHCFSGYEVYKGKPIFYGLGNFCFDSKVDNQYRHKTWNYGYMVSLSFCNEDVKFELIPYEQCWDKPGIHLFEEDEKIGFYSDIQELNRKIKDDKLLVESYREMASCRRDSVYSGFRPYSNRIMCSLYAHGLLPSFLSGKRLTEIRAILDCEAHHEVLNYNLSNDDNSSKPKI